jgi:hypothetical protein
LVFNWLYSYDISYATTLTTRRLLDHLVEANSYSEKDLISIDLNLKEMREIVATGEDKYSPRLLALLTQRLDGCDSQLRKLQAGMSRLSPELVSINEKLVSISRSVKAAATHSTVSST